MIATAKARRLLVFLAVGVMLAALVDVLAPDDGPRVTVITPTPTPEAHELAPIVPPVTLDALLATTGREEARRDVGSAWTSDEWERHVRSSASPLPLPAEVAHQMTTPEATPGGVTAASTDPVVGTAGSGFESRPGAPLTEAEVYELALAVSGSPVWARQAAAVAWCESRYHPGAVGAVGERGLLQVRPEYHGAVPADPEGQIEQAFALWSEAGWRPWSCNPGGAE